jgi:hypothetical protein
MFVSVIPQHEGQSALHYCFKFHYQQLANTLLSYGADDTLPNNFGLTPYEGLTLDDLAQYDDDEEDGDDDDDNSVERSD